MRWIASVIKWILCILIVCYVFYKSFILVEFDGCKESGGTLGLNGGCVLPERGSNELR